MLTSRSVQSRGREDPPEEGTAPTPVSLPENPVGRGAWRATGREAAESERTKQLTCSLSLFHSQALPEANPGLCSSESLKLLFC